MGEPFRIIWTLGNADATGRLAWLTFQRCAQGKDDDEHDIRVLALIGGGGAKLGCRRRGAG